MAVCGVKLNFSKTTLATAIKNAKGRVSHIAKALNCHIKTVNIYIDEDPELKDLLKEYRFQRDEKLLDGAEDTLQDAVDARLEDRTNALKSAFFILNTKGRVRGYIPREAPDNTNIQITPQQALELFAKSSADTL